MGLYKQNPKACRAAQLSSEFWLEMWVYRNKINKITTLVTNEYNCESMSREQNLNEEQNYILMSSINKSLKLDGIKLAGHVYIQHGKEAKEKKDQLNEEYFS